MSKLWKTKKRPICEERMFDYIINIIDFGLKKHYRFGQGIDSKEISRKIIELLRKYELG